MDRRFEKPIALFTSLVALSATALVMFTVPTGATTSQTGCRPVAASVAKLRPLRTQPRERSWDSSSI